MNKAVLIKRLQKEMGYDQDEATRIVEAMMDVLTESLAQRDKLTLSGIGTLAVVQPSPDTLLPDQDACLKNDLQSRDIKFSPGQRLKEALAALDFITKDLD